MQGDGLKTARALGGWSQMEAAALLGVSQAYYSQLESGTRVVTAELAERAVGALQASPLILPLPPLALTFQGMGAGDLAAALGWLGYEGFAYLARMGRRANPALVVASALACKELDVRVVEGLPWVMRQFPDLDWGWLVGQCRLVNAQNRLGYVVWLAGGPEWVLRELEASRLAPEGTLCRESMPVAERRWVAAHRPAAAAHWGLLTTLGRADVE